MTRISIAATLRYSLKMFVLCVIFIPAEVSPTQAGPTPVQVTFTETPAREGPDYPLAGMRRYYETPARDQYKNINDVFYNDLTSKGDFYINPDIIAEGVNRQVFELTPIWESEASANLPGLKFRIHYWQYSIKFLKGPQTGQFTRGGLVIGRALSPNAAGESATWIYSTPYATTRDFLKAIAAALSAAENASGNGTSTDLRKNEHRTFSQSIDRRIDALSGRGKHVNLTKPLSSYAPAKSSAEPN
jgi:hypothetical protein